ncbi:ATP-binding protein [Streptosporangiaceae bacterium NEAU-GS5]|nr:ATP-binding protein [Streptosporangiaceae bacterium NEAU-GS5]
MLKVLGDGLGLTGFERDLLLMCAGVELDTAFAHACAEVQGDAARTYATFGLGLARLADAHWDALSPARPLRRWHLVELAQPDVPTTSPLRIDERILHALAGVSYLDSRIAPYAEPLAGPSSLPLVLRAAVETIGAHWSRPGFGSSPVVAHGRRRSDLRSVAAAACLERGMRPLRLRAADLPEGAAERDRLARLCERETVLDGVAWVVDVDVDDSGDGPRGERLALDFAARLAAPVVLTARKPLSDSRLRPVGVEVGEPGPGDTRAVWVEALGSAAGPLAAWVDRAVGQFDLDADAIKAVARSLAPMDGPGDRAGGGELWEACRRQARPGLDDLAQRIDPQARWADLVLPALQTSVLKQIVAYVRHRHTVLVDWGFAARTGRGLGAAALFAGPSGTGKTLAAEVVAGELHLDLYRIDLSQVVSKYIGETEKNLGRLFDAAEAGGAVLLFDEADALFGKRGEVKDSHDRYANIEVGYLLQRIEIYRGVAILTTNLKETLDPAFLRRLRFVVQFPFPDAEARSEIWRRIFPAQTPKEGLDPIALSRLPVSGGTIHNIALAAALLAADAGEPVRMGHLLAAARTECAKLERPLTGAEVAGWA